MIEAGPRQIDIEKVPSERVPYFLLLPRERDVLQLTSEGLTRPEIAAKLHISVETVKVHRRNVNGIGDLTPRVSRVKGSPDEFRLIALALIQDGVRNGYIEHKLPLKPLQDLDPQEAEFADYLLEGKNVEQTAKDFLLTRKKAFEIMGSIYDKLQCRNIYQLAARLTYLEAQTARVADKELALAS